MDRLKSLSVKIYPAAMVIVILAGIGIIIAAGFAASVPLKVALALGGVGLLFLGMITTKVVYEEKRSQDKLDTLLAKLDEIQQEIQQEEKQGKSGIAIADVISSSLKFYADYKEKDRSEE